MAAKAKLSDELALKRTELAARRTIMAADRSLMAWVRTGLALIGFGFTIYAFLQSVVEKGQLTMISPDKVRRIGLFLLALGVISILLGALQDWMTVRSIKKIYGVAAWRFTLVIAGSVGALGIFLFVSIFLKIHLM